MLSGQSTDEGDLEHRGEPLGPQRSVAEDLLEHGVERAQIEQCLVDVEGQYRRHGIIPVLGMRRARITRRGQRGRSCTVSQLRPSSRVTAATMVRSIMSQRTQHERRAAQGGRSAGPGQSAGVMAEHLPLAPSCVQR